MAKHKIGRFSVIPARTRSVVNVSHFFGGPDGTTRFCWPWFKIKGTFTSNWRIAQNGQNQGWAPENDPYLGNGKFFGWKFISGESRVYWWYSLLTKNRDSKNLAFRKVFAFCDSGFSDKWVPELLLPLKLITMYGPKAAIFAPKYALLPAHLVPFWLVCWWLWCAGCISEDTYLL